MTKDKSIDNELCRSILQSLRIRERWVDR